VNKRLPSVLATVPWAVAVGGAIAAWFLPASRSAVVLNLVAVLAALYLGLRAYRISALQSAQATQAIILSRQPLLTAVHEPTGWPWESVQDEWFPAEEPFLVGESPQEPAPAQPVRAFSVMVGMNRGGDRTYRALVYIRNTGEGPAMIEAARMWSGLGLAGQVSGNTSLGAGEVEPYNCELRTGADGAETMAQTAARWAATTTETSALLSAWQSRDPERLYFLEIRYHDIFGARAGQLALRAWFDPSGRGQWLSCGALSYPPPILQPGDIPQARLQGGR
jgi:hypothetical protein